MVDKGNDIRENIREIARIAKLSHSALAKKAGLAPSTVNKILNSETNHSISKTSLDKLAKAAGFGSYEDYVLEHLSTAPVPPFGMARDGAHMHSLGDASVAGFEANPLRLRQDGIVAMRIENDDLKPVLSQGDHIYYKERASGIAPEALGAQAVVEDKYGRRYIGILSEDISTGKYELHSLSSGETISGLRLKWAAKILHISFK